MFYVISGDIAPIAAPMKALVGDTPHKTNFKI